MSLSNILLIPGIDQMSFRDALSILSPYDPLLSYNLFEPANSLFQGTTLTPVTAVTNPVGVVIDQTQGGLGNLGAELAGTIPVPSVANLSGTVGVWTAGTRTMTNTGSTVGGYPRFSFEFGLVANRLYLVSGRLSGDLTAISSIRPGGTTNSIGYNSSTGVFYGVGLASNSTLQFVTGLAVGQSLTIEELSVREIPGYHATASSDAKRPLWNSFSVNGRTVRGAVFDGSDDCLQVSGFDLSNTDEVCVIAGVRKLSDAATATIVELSATISSNNGAFQLLGPNGANPNYLFRSRGTVEREATSGNSFAAPNTSFLVGTGDISGDVSRLIINGTQAAINTGDQGTGNFGNYTLNIGGRNNAAASPFNGAISVLFVLGAIPPDDVLTRVFRGLAPQIGVSV